MSRNRTSNAIGDRVRALADSDLSSLILELRFNTRLEQATLAKALAEQRRRRRKAKAAES